MPNRASRLSDVSIPVREDDLWLPGELLQIEGSRFGGFKGGLVKGAAVHIVILTRDRLVVKGAETSEFDMDDITEYSKYGVGFYEPESQHRVRGILGEVTWPTRDISKVVLDKLGAATRLEIWVRDENQQERKVIRLYISSFLPKTIMNLANKAADEGIIRRSRIRGYNWHAWPLYRKVLERRLKQAVPSATIIIKGRMLDEETFRRLVR